MTELEQNLKLQMDIAYHFVNCIERSFTATREEQKESSEHYKFIPSLANKFVSDLISAHTYLNKYRPKFLDVGCGIGSKVILADYLFDAYGLEIDRKYIEQGHKLFNTNKIIHADALGYAHYNEYDVIFAYRPIKSLEGSTLLMNRILEQIKSGTIIIAHGFHTAFSHDFFGCEKICMNEFKWSDIRIKK